MANVTHIQAFRAQPVFADEAKLNVIGHTWRDGTPGYRFYERGAGKDPGDGRRGDRKADALTEPFTEKACQGHLRWLYTSAGGLLEVDGQKFAAPTPEPKPVAPAKKPKAKKSKKAEVQAAA